GSFAADSCAVARTSGIFPVRAVAATSAGCAAESNRPVLCCFSCRNLVQPGAPGDGRPLSRQAGAGPLDYGHKLCRLGGNLAGCSLVSREVVSGEAVQ